MQIQTHNNSTSTNADSGQSINDNVNVIPQDSPDLKDFDHLRNLNSTASQSTVTLDSESIESLKTKSNGKSWYQKIPCCCGKGLSSKSSNSKKKKNFNHPNFSNSNAIETLGTQTSGSNNMGPPILQITSMVTDIYSGRPKPSTTRLVDPKNLPQSTPILKGQGKGEAQQLNDMSRVAKAYLQTSQEDVQQGQRQSQKQQTIVQGVVGTGIEGSDVTKIPEKRWRYPGIVYKIPQKSTNSTSDSDSLVQVLLHSDIHPQYSNLTSGSKISQSFSYNNYYSKAPMIIRLMGISIYPMEKHWGGPITNTNNKSQQSENFTSIATAEHNNNSSSSDSDSVENVIPIEQKASTISNPKHVFLDGIERDSDTDGSKPTKAKAQSQMTRPTLITLDLGNLPIDNLINSAARLSLFQSYGKNYDEISLSFNKYSFLKERKRSLVFQENYYKHRLEKLLQQQQQQLNTLRTKQQLNRIRWKLACKNVLLKLNALGAQTVTSSTNDCELPILKTNSESSGSDSNSTVIYSDNLEIAKYCQTNQADSNGDKAQKFSSQQQQQIDEIYKLVMSIINNMPKDYGSDENNNESTIIQNNGPGLSSDSEPASKQSSFKGKVRLPHTLSTGTLSIVNIENSYAKDANSTTQTFRQHFISRRQIYQKDGLMNLCLRQIKQKYADNGGQSGPFLFGSSETNICIADIMVYSLWRTITQQSKLKANPGSKNNNSGSTDSDSSVVTSESLSPDSNPTDLLIEGFTTTPTSLFPEELSRVGKAVLNSKLVKNYREWKGREP